MVLHETAFSRLNWLPHRRSIRQDFQIVPSEDILNQESEKSIRIFREQRDAVKTHRNRAGILLVLFFVFSFFVPAFT